MFSLDEYSSPLPWLLALPLCLVVPPSIILSGLPDQAADDAAGKRTLVVRCGEFGAVYIAILCTVFAALCAAILTLMPSTR